MIRLIIGSSNVAATYKPESFKGYPPYNMAKCTRMEVFKVVMDGVKEEKEVMIAVIENFICDTVRAIPTQSPNLIDGAIDASITEFLGVVRETAQRLPTTRFALAQPILIPRDTWYTERYEDLCRSYVAGVNALGLENVSKLEAMSKQSQNFVHDGVHLTKESSTSYINGLLYNADSFFSAEIVNLEEGTSKKPERLRERTDELQLDKEFEKSVKMLDEKLEELNRSMFNRRFHDSLVMARIREDIDTISNTNKENKMIISGMVSKTPRPAGREEARKWLREIVTEVLEDIEKGSSKEIIFISQRRSNNRNIPLAEVRLSSKEVLKGLRKRFAEKKAGHNFGKIYVANCDAGDTSQN
jgi:hypothetical protein